MKIKLTVVTVATFVAMTVGYIADTASPIPGDPVPGVDVSIEQSPSGIIIAQTSTNSNGIFEVGNLPPGKYKITWRRLPGQTATTSAAARGSNNYNSAKSNTAGFALGTKDETWDITLEMSPKDVKVGTNPGLEVTIGPKGGTIGGLVTVPSTERMLQRSETNVRARPSPTPASGRAGGATAGTRCTRWQAS